MNKYNRFIVAFIIAPLAAPLVMYMVLLLDLQKDQQIFSFENISFSDLSGLVETFKIILLAGTIVAYCFAFLFGLPLYWLFNRKGLINYRSLTIGGTLIASLPVVLMNMSEGLSKLRENLSIYLMLALCGCAVANVFYLINDWKTSEKTRGR